MEWIQQLNNALDYIEGSLTSTVDLGEAARIACCSSYHFSRMFSYIAGVPLSEYVRRRKMSQAAFDLQTFDVKIIGLALRYGYDSPTSFNRAFQGIHGVSPSAAREQGVSLVSYPRIAFHIAIKGDVEMHYRIEQKESFRIVGAKRTYSMNTDQNFVEIPQFWAQAAQSGQIEQVAQMCDGTIPGVLGVSVGDFTDMTKDFDYFIATTTKAKPLEGMEEYLVPAATWAIFEEVGQMPDAMQNLQRRIVAEWLPQSSYAYSNAIDIEVYLSMPDEKDQKFEVWVPVVKKS